MECPRCGENIGEGYSYCPNCGVELPREDLLSKYVDDGKNYNTTLYKVAVAFYILTIALFVLFAIVLPQGVVIGPNGESQMEPTVANVLRMVLLAPLLWNVPMLIYLLALMKKNKPAPFAFKLLTFLFSNAISGIMLFLSNDQTLKHL